MLPCPTLSLFILCRAALFHPMLPYPTLVPPYAALPTAPCFNLCCPALPCHILRYAAPPYHTLFHSRLCCPYLPYHTLPYFYLMLPCPTLPDPISLPMLRYPTLCCVALDCKAELHYQVANLLNTDSSLRLPPSVA